MSTTSLAVAMYLTCVIAELQRRSLAAEPQERHVWSSAISSVRKQLQALAEDET